MLRKGLLYTAVLVGVYLGLSKATAGGDLLKAAGTTYVSGVKALQGR